MRVPTLSALLVAVVVAVGLAGISPSPAEAAATRLAWLDDLTRAVSRARELPRIPALGSAAGRSDDFARSLDDLIARAPAPPARTPEITTRLTELRTIRTRTQNLQVAIADADNARNTIATDARAVAELATPDPTLRAELSRAGDAILRDAGCDLAAGLLLPPEEDEVEQSGWIDVVPDVLQPVAEPFGEAAISYAKERLARAVGPAAASTVQWYLWGTGIQDKAGRFGTALQEQVDAPNGVQTRAYIQYVRTCLAIPR